MDLDIMTVLIYLEELKYVHYEAATSFNYLGDKCACAMQNEMGDKYAEFIKFLMNDEIFSDLNLEEKFNGRN